MDLHGLTIKTRQGHDWHWAGSETVINKRGTPVRIERLAAQCAFPGCSHVYEAKQKLPKSVFTRYQARNPHPDRYSDMTVTLTSRYGNLAVRTCPQHRGALGRRRIKPEDLI